MAALTEELDGAPALARKMELALASALTRELELASAPALAREMESALASALTRELDRAPAPALARETESALPSALTREPDQALARETESALPSALTREPDRAPAPALAREMESALPSALTRELDRALAQPQGAGDAGVLTLIRLRNQMKDQFMEYNTAVLAGQENCPDHVIEEKCIQSASQDLQRDTEEVKVSFQNKALALQRIQIMDILRNKVSQDDEESRLILETMKHIILLNRTIIEYEQQARWKEQQLTDIKRKRLSLKKDGRQKLWQVQNMMKRPREKRASVNITETQKLLDKLEEERQMTTLIQNVFQAVIIGSRVNWAEDPSLKTIVLQVEKNLS